MNRVTKILVPVITTATLALSGVAHAGLFSKEEWEKDDCPSRHSKAWCVLKFGAAAPNKRYMFNDAKLTAEQKLEVESALANSTKNIAGGATAGVGAGMAMGLSAGVSLGSLLRSSAFGALAITDILGNMFFNGEEVYKHALFVWPPTDKPAMEAANDFIDSYLNAWKTVLGADKVEIQLLPEDKQTQFGRHKIVGIGGACGEQQCVLFSGHIAFLDQYRTGERILKKKDMPAFLNGGDAYFAFSFLDSLPSISEYYLAAPSCNERPLLLKCPGVKEVKLNQEQLMLMSSKLPAYAYIYVGMDKADKNSLPYLLNQGKPMLFVN